MHYRVGYEFRDDKQHFVVGCQRRESLARDTRRTPVRRQIKLDVV
jgi:hypothetical protein